jgi:hypothetical protein
MYGVSEGKIKHKPFVEFLGVLCVLVVLMLGMNGVDISI